MRQVTEIITHCSATPPNWRAGQSVEAKRDEIRRWHLARGWRGIGYAAIIDRDGSIALGRDLNNDGDTFDDIGAHTKGRNSRSIGICLLGGKGSHEHDDFLDHFTPEQDKALRQIIVDIQREYPSAKKVSGHNQYAAKACPGFQVQRWFVEGVGQPEAPSVSPQPDPAEQQDGLWAGLVAALAGIFGKGKA